MLHSPLRPLAVAIVALGFAAPSVLWGPAAAQEPAAGENTVVAVVEGEQITRQDLEQLKVKMAGQVPQVANMPLEALYQGLLDRAITEKLLLKQAREQDLAEDPQVKEQMQAVENELIQRAYLARAVEERITDEQLQEAYQQFLKDNPAQQEVKARHILVETEEKAKELIEQLKGGADFEELAKTASTGPSGPRGGDLGWFAKDAMVPEFAEAAFSLEKGQITEEPVKTQFGWHVIKVEDTRTTEAPTFEEAKEQLQAGLAEQALEDVVADLRKDAEIQTFGLDGKPVQEGAAQ